MTGTPRLVEVEIDRDGIKAAVWRGGLRQKLFRVTDDETWDVFAVDRTGNTARHPIYPDVLPALAVYVAPRSGQPSGTTAGDDSTGDGTIAKPYATITKAIQARTSTRNVIVFRGGTIGGPGHGSDASYSGGAIWNAGDLTLQPYRAEQVKLDGDHTADKLMVLASNGTPQTHTVHGLVLQAYVGSVSNANAGALYCSSGTNGTAAQIVEDVVIRDTDGIGINWFKPRGSLGTRMSRYVVRDTDSTGITGTHNFGSSWTPGVEPTWDFRNDMVFEHGYVTRSNTGDHRSPGEGYPNDVGGNAGSFQGGYKIHGYLGCTVYGGIIEDINYDQPKGPGGYGTGVWYDVGNREANVISTFARRCARSAFFWEVSSTGVCLSNIAVDCGHGKNFSNYRIASPLVRVAHCSSFGGASSGETYDDVRSLASDGYGWDTMGDQLDRCLLVGPTSGPNAENFLWRLYDNGQKAGGTGTNPPDYYAPPGKWVQNVWYLGGTPNIVRWDQTPPGNQTYQTPAQLHNGDGTHAAHPDLGGSDVLLSAITVDSRWRITATTPTLPTMAVLEQEYADLIGVAAGVSYKPGAIVCPRPTW